MGSMLSSHVPREQTEAPSCPDAEAQISHQLQTILSRAEDLKQAFPGEGPLRLLVLGPRRHGKSAFINTLFHVGEQRWGRPFIKQAASGGHRRACTRRVAPYMLLPSTPSSSASFVVFDSPAVGCGDQSNWGGRLEQYVDEVLPDCVLVVMSLSEFEAEEGRQFLTLEELVDAVRDAQQGSLETIIVGTKLDQITGALTRAINPEEYHQRLRTHLKIRSTDCVFTLANYVEKDNEVFRCLKSDRTVLHILEQAIVFGWHRRAAAKLERSKGKVDCLEQRGRVDEDLSNLVINDGVVQ